MNTVKRPEHETPHARPLGGVGLRWAGEVEHETPEFATFSFTHVVTGKHTTVRVRPNILHCFGLEAGTYRVSVFAQGCDPHRIAVEVPTGRMVPVKPTLVRRTDERPTLESILAPFRAEDSGDPHDLDVPAGQFVRLHTTDTRFKGDWREIEVPNIAAAKAMFGNPDEFFPGDLPRFDEVARTPATSPDQVARLTAQEYVYGKSTSVQNWRKQIDETVFDELWKFPLFTYGTVTINRNATLQLGTDANFFACSLLRIHATGTLRIAGDGPVHVEPAAIEVFC